MTKRAGIIGSTTSTGAPTWRDDELQAWERDFLTAGVIPGVGSTFAVSQRGAGANMSVDVATGHALVSITNSNLTPSKTYNVYFDSDAVTNVLITAADPTNPRIDIICLKVDVSQNPDAGAGNIASIIAVAGTPAGSPSAPATPSNCLLLAQVAVAASAASIVNANITDKRTYVDLSSTSALASLLRASDAQKETVHWLGSVSGTNTLTGSASPAVTSYTAGHRFAFLAAGANTGAVTLNVNSVGAVAVKRLDGATALVASDIKAAGQLVVVQFDGTNFQMLTPAGQNPAVTNYLKAVQEVANAAFATDNVNNTASETAFASKYSAPANFLAAATDKFMVKAMGGSSTKSSGPGNLTIKLKYGSMVLFSSGSIALSTNVSDKGWWLDAHVVCQTQGASGKLHVVVHLYFEASATKDYYVFNLPNSNTDGTITSFDTTAAQDITISVQFDTASTGNSISLLDLDVVKLSKTAF